MADRQTDDGSARTAERFVRVLGGPATNRRPGLCGGKGAERRTTGPKRRLAF